MTENPQRENREQCVIFEVFIGDGQNEWQQSNFGHLARLRSAEDVRVHLANLRRLKFRVAARNLHTLVLQRGNPIVFVSGQLDLELAGCSVAGRMSSSKCWTASESRGGHRGRCEKSTSRRIRCVPIVLVR